MRQQGIGLSQQSLCIFDGCGLPFTVLALDDAEQVAEALRARGGFTKLEND
jgi:hypothetical protein